MKHESEEPVWSRRDNAIGMWEEVVDHGELGDDMLKVGAIYLLHHCIEDDEEDITYNHHAEELDEMGGNERKGRVFFGMGNREKGD